MGCRQRQYPLRRTSSRQRGEQGCWLVCAVAAAVTEVVVAAVAVPLLCGVRLA